MYPTVVLNNESSLRQFPIIGTGTIRGNLFQGDIYRDDVFAIIPFPNQIMLFENVSGLSIQCLLKNLNREAYPGRLPFYITLFEPIESEYYDVVTDDYHCTYLQALFDTCLKEPFPALQSYKVRANVSGTNEILKHYI